MACYNVCPNSSIKMKREFDGCDYPYINTETCLHCLKCKNVCPVMRQRIQKEEGSPSVYAGHCLDEDTRRNSSSGGVFSLVAQWCIENGGVVFGAAYEKNRVIHCKADTMEGIRRFQGSKYVQSDIGTTYIQAEEALKKGRYVLFTGLPCQIEGLRSYLNREYEKLYTIDLICHGVGSPGIWEKYLKVFHHKKNIYSINFRNKDKGWDPVQFVIQYDDGKEYRPSPLADYYEYGFNNNVFLRSSCYACKFKGINRNSDFTIGDAWGVKSYAPRFKDNKGCSLIFIHSRRGQVLFDEIKECMKYQAVDIRKALHWSRNMLSSVSDNPKREVFYKNLKKYPFRLCMILMKKGD